MNENALRALLGDLPRGPIRYFDRIDSTNLEALRWVRSGAAHLALVVADEQTAGRGRMGRRWYTPPGAALAFSLILRPEQLPLTSLTRLTALGALAVCTALSQRFDLLPQIKWPNDVLLDGRKFAGILVEAIWQGEELEAAVLGIGINVARESLPPEETLLFPATCLEDVLGNPIDRWIVLREVLDALFGWIARMHTSDFLNAWEDQLAFRGQLVRVYREGQAAIEGLLAGLSQDGSLLLHLPSGQTWSVSGGEVHLRPVSVDT